ncbi:helix-turn-helix domain-containing protein [Paenibacillus melissococcoides]|uniref:Helix-turn-helix domain-containing protein n=1 Tax=Paenibacillus melissococcoides TaxID=2912268 RepID=A0ABN8U2C5_9BACL|nr:MULTISPECIES: helix-turn-helix transcriptional regulator [Paenibacillus]GIO81674.1 helix-turn-helix transcriptional regulator [Paenibacillus dendritiformis]CAH8245105.1 helix-turn-helix domain-containing protein [Paenibacillus melissococcoides]CAH8709916.1 helix-turn-helix domain-containing protein [Paenibacillus melissococcoides]CAH8710643.1 helix-turn-helix domain-containing protein [Paenibacillus melissococcoides]
MSLQLSLEALRINAGMTQQDVADKLGVSRQTVMKWEGGHAEPKELVIYALAKLYDVDLDVIRVPSSA